MNQARPVTDDTHRKGKDQLPRNYTGSVCRLSWVS
jgi:hypothetical protein